MSKPLTVIGSEHCWIRGELYLSMNENACGRWGGQSSLYEQVFLRGDQRALDSIRPETLLFDAVRQLLFELRCLAAIAVLVHAVVQGHHMAAGEFCCALRFSQLLLAAEVRL